MAEERGPALARRLWTLFEPVHAVIYFHETAFAALEAAGLRGFWRGYFAGRAAPLGPVGEAPVRAAFFGFSASMTTRALPAVWDLVTPEQALAARLEAAGQTLRHLLDTEPRDLERLADDLWTVTRAMPCDGRVLAAANAVLPRPDDPYQRLWLATTVLREHRGDGHVAALVAAGLSGLESLVLRTDLDRSQLRSARGWTDTEWDDAAETLVARGLMSDPETIADRGRHVLTVSEGRTDILAWDGWSRAGATEADARRLAHELHRPAVLCRAVLPRINPIGVPEVGDRPD